LSAQTAATLRMRKATNMPKITPALKCSCRSLSLAASALKSEKPNNSGPVECKRSHTSRGAAVYGIEKRQVSSARTVDQLPRSRGRAGAFDNDGS